MKQEFKVTGMTCAACSAGIQKTVGKMKGVRKAEVSLMGEKMQVDYDESSLSSDQIIAAVEDLGYGASVKTGEESAVAEKKAPISSAGEEAKSSNTDSLRPCAFSFRSCILRWGICWARLCRPF